VSEPLIVAIREWATRPGRWAGRIDMTAEFGYNAAMAEVVGMLDFAASLSPATPPALDRETIRSALKGARGLALDSGATDLDAELGRAIDLLDGLP